MRNLICKLSVILILSVTGLNPGLAQNINMKLGSAVIDFGNIAAVMHPVKTIEFTNISTQRLAILVVEKSVDAKVNYPHTFFEPGEKGTISVSYEAGKLGPFSETIKVFTNLDNDPYLITLKGTSITLEECFPDKANMNVRNVLVIDKNTQKPMGQVTVLFVHNFKTNNPLTCKTDKTGNAVKELPIGQYNAKAEIVGYEPYQADFYLPRSQPQVVIEMVPKVVKAPDVPVIENPQHTHEVKVVDKPVVYKDLPEDKYAANNIVLLLDVSSSMTYKGKFTLLQQSVNNLVMALRPIDNVSIITYASDAKVVLTAVSGDQKDKIIETVQELKPFGSTQGVKGLNTAYDLATQKFITGGNNQVILATDGEFSEKNLTDDYYKQFISGYTEKGIKLSILGFGVNPGAIDRMQKMSGYGNGNFIHIESEKFVKDILINEIKNMSFMGKP
jgi:Mg-chelatase subunit ChlD